MENTGNWPSRINLEQSSLTGLGAARWNLTPPQLVEHVLARSEGVLSSVGALVVRTGQFTGRSPKDKYIVRDETSESAVHWGPVNQPLTEEAFEAIHRRLARYWEGREVFVQDCFGGAGRANRMPIRVVTEMAWHSLFAHQLFVRPEPGSTSHHAPEFTLLFAPGLHANPSEHGTNSETCVALSFKRRLVIIAGTMYAGEMKKSVFTILNHLLPERGILPMHCSANTSSAGDTALFFGLSGTGKTTLSADPHRRLIGDDEHGWGDDGIFNFEGGCYAKCIGLTVEREPQIWNAIRFGSVLENVIIDEITREPDYHSDAITENTRAAYPVDYIDNAVIPGVGGHPSHIVFLAADAFGVLPPVARLTPEQAMYHFLSGYTAKVAGTERGLGKEPQATFSACFGSPFLPRHPQVYAHLLGEKIRRHDVTCWLVNTGWIRGPYGTGERMHLPHTRAIVNAAIGGQLEDVPAEPDPVFHLAAPKFCPGVPRELLDPRAMWSDPRAYDEAACHLAARFRTNFEKFGAVEPEILQASPAA